MNLEVTPYKKIEILYYGEESFFEVKEFIEEKEISSYKIASSGIGYMTKLKQIIYEKRKQGFFDFSDCYDSNSEMEIIPDKRFNFLLKCPEYCSSLITTKYLEAFELAVEISLDVTEDDFIIYEDVIETYNYFIENQNNLVRELKLDFWGFVLEDLETFYEIELNIYEDKDEDLKKYLNKERYEYRKKEAGEFLDLHKRANEATEKNDELIKLKILDELLQIRSIDINSIKYEPSDIKYGRIWLYFSYELDKEHGAEMILVNGKV